MSAHLLQLQDSKIVARPLTRLKSSRASFVSYVDPGFWTGVEPAGKPPYNADSLQSTRL